MLKIALSITILTLSIFANSFVGKASWYGKDFQGKLTASGEKYNMYSYTAAHKTLPFGTVVTVTNLTNNRSIDVKINDRGPYADGRILDLSYLAAKQIGLINMGIAKVKVEVKYISKK